MIGSPGNDESASSKETRPSRLNDSHSISPNTAITISTINNDYRFEEEEGGSKQSESCLLEPPSPSAPTAVSTPSPPAPSTIQATSSQHEQSIKSLSPPPASGTRSRSMSLVPGLDMLSPILFSGIIGGHSGPGSTVGETSKPSGPSRERKNSCLTERTPQFMTVAPSFTTRTSGTNGPWSHDRIARARQSIDVRSFPSYLARKRQSIIGARLFDTLVEVAGSPLQAITPEGDENEDNRSSTDNNSGKNNDSRGSRKSLIHRLRGNRKSISDEEPEAPTLSLGERVAWLKSKGPEFGTVRWIGRLPKVSASWTVGVEFDNAIGCTDGKFEGRRYFTAKDTFAKFLPLSSLTRVDNIIGRHRSGTLLSRMSVQLKPGQLISVQRESENNLPIHCALNAPHHIDHDVHVPNMNHCLCNNCNHPCAHLCKTKKPKGRKTDMAHMCHFSQKPHNKLCCGGEELLYSLASAQDLEMAMNGSPQVGDCLSHGRRRLNSNLSSNTTNNGESTSGAPNGSHRRRSGRSDASRRRSSGSSSTIRRLRDKSRRISSAPTSTERKAESQTKSEGEVGGGNGTGHQAGDNEQEEGEREEEGQVIIGLGKGADCEEGLMSLDSRSNFALCKLKSASELSISSLPSTAASQVEVYIARGALTDESDLDDDDEYGDEEDEEEDNADDDGCSSGLVSSQGRRYLKGSTHGKRSTRNQRRRRRRQLRVGASGNCSRSMTTLTGRSSRSSRRRNSSDGGGTGIGHGGDDDCSRTRRSGKRSGLRSLVSCLVPSIPNSYKKNDKSSKKGKKTKNGQNNRRSKNADNPSKRTLDNNSNCDSSFYHYSHYPCSCDGQSTFIDPMGPIDSNGHPLVYSLQDQHYLYSSHHHYHHPSHASHNPQQHSTDHRHHYHHQQQQHSSSYHHHHHAHRHQQQQNSSKQLAHFNSTNNRQQNHSSSSTHHQHHHHQQQQQQQQQQQHNCAPQATTCSSSLSRRSRQRKYHGLSTSPEPSPSVSVKNRSSLQHSNLHQHHHYPVEDNLTFGVGVGLAGRASPCGHFYYSPCSVSASQLSIGALQKHLSTTTISKSQATKGKENSQSKHRQPNSPPKDQADSNTNQEQGSKGLQRLVDLDDNLCELTHKTVDNNIEILSDLNAKSNCLLTSSPPCSTEKTNLIESALNNTNKDCLINLDSNHSNNLVNNKSANSKSIENNYTNHNNSNNNKYNRINNEVNISSKSSNHHSCNGINHAFSPRLYESNSIGSPGFDGRLIGTANNNNYQYQQQQYRHEPTCSPSSSTTKTTANGINGENVLTNENNCSYNDNTNYDNDNNSNYNDDNYDYRKNRDEKNEITNDNEMDCNESSMSEQNNHNVIHDSSNSNSNRKLNNFKIEVELTCSPSVQSYTSSSMISPRRKRKGPAPPPPVNKVTAYTSFPSIPGPSGVNVSPFTSPSSSGSSPSASQPATPLHSTSQGEPSTPSTSSSLLSPSSYPILAPSNSQSSSISSGPSTSTWQSHSTTQSMGRKKSIKTKPAPSPPPPLPPLPPIASASEMQRSSPTKPTVKTPTATNKNNDNGASSFVQKSSPRTPLSVNMLSTNCTSNRPSTCQPVIKCLPCRSHSVPVCPMVTLTRSLSDQKQINVKNMLKSVASYSSDLALPQSTVGLIASSRAIQQTLESDSIIITYDEPDYLYPIHHGLTNCYSSCEIPYNISCNTNSPNYIGTNNGSNNLLMVCKEDAKVVNNINCKMNDKGLRIRQKSQSFESTSLPTSPMHQKSITDRPPRPPRPSSIVNYKMINQSHPVIPMRTKRRSLVGSTCCTHGCRPDTLTLKERSGSLPLRPRSLPASPISKPYQGSSSTLPSPKSTSSTQSNLTFTRDKTLSGSFSGSTNQGNTANINPSHTMCSIGCLTSCSLCSLSGLDGTTSTSTSNPTDQSTHLNYPSKDVHVNHDDDEDNCSNIYEEIDFTSISENVAALVSPRQLINPNAVNNNVSRNHLQCESEKDKIANDLVNCDENNNGKNNVDNGNDMVITCNKEPNVVSIDSTRRLSSSSGPQANNSGGEILSDTSDDRVTVKSVNIKPWAYSTSSLDSEQSTTSSGSTVKQWNNQIIYSSHHHPCHPHHEQHHESQSPNYPHHHHHYDHNHSHHSDALSSPCFHGNFSDFYQGIDHPHPFHHPHSHHHHQAHHLYPYQMTNNHLLHASLDHCHHCPYHHHHHHAPRQMITTSTSDHSLSSLSSNFSEDPATPTPPMMTLDDYTFHSSNFTFTPEDHYLVSPCCPEHLDEQDEDDVINDKKGSLKHSDDKEEEVNVAFKNEVKNGFGLIPCYPQPFYPIPDLVCDKETNEDENDDDDEDEEDNDDSVGKRFNKMTLKEDRGEQVKEDDEKGKEKKLLVNFKSSSVSSLKNSVKSSWPVKGKDAIPSLSSSPTSSSPSSAHQPAIFSPFVKPLKDNQLNNSVHNSNINCYCHQCFLPHCAKSTFNSTHHNLNHQRKDTFKAESPSKMASSWDGSLSGAGGCSSGGGSGAGDDSNESTTHQYHHQSPNGSASINRLMQELQLAISFGQHRKAALLARQLALRKVSCTFKQPPNSTAIDDQPIM